MLLQENDDDSDDNDYDDFDPRKPPSGAYSVLWLVHA